METKLLLSDIYSPVEKHFPLVENKIREILDNANELSSEVIRYFFQAKGKFLRPALCLFGAGFSNHLPPSVITNAAALEIFHSATLIHDDIIDSAYLRRNIPTIHSVWGPQVAVLVGDFLHDKAIEAIFKLKNDRAIASFLKTAGVVCDGEILELSQKSNFALREDEYITIIERKTAVLLGCCLETSAILAGLADAEVAALKNYGIYFGIAFQMIDDCLDYAGLQNEFGKTLGSDLAEGVLTLPLIHLLAHADETTQNEVKQIVQSGVRGGENLAKLVEYLKEFGSLEAAMRKAREYTDRARLELSVLKDHPAKKSLNLLLNYILERNR
ncbi:MAG: hypothetical protein COV74_07255 [Candidatus Omnitrophica bacterium CG11_big_fil_rev_8_21_14_0_20_45_26]|uniref:Polyprenyl synthetase n=1 Tax=Candidatus Abzuiibacterium crystallinum TaxID=1974748 RepID=A0A2H0LQN7_9BACT|nr:MAG: hypothetical protein COV74_07255 [Candidatus Omnitrophica bacterium CG11_big_fil_rev_8_21_14_0_20_45_26]PIW65496.1 MAG: hypothetical protein COW12_01515 [Candidatus Omnitrophica bacterium CG12_big_fil_rev_8_21_14_0_65_45_16]